MKGSYNMAQIVAGTPYWSSITQIPQQYPYLTEDIQCDIAIVGGGASGALAAYQLSKENIDTVLVDANLFGFGSTSVCSSVLQYEIDYDLTGLKELIGLEKALRAFRACVKGLDDLSKLIVELDQDVGFTRRDCFYYSPDCAGVEQIKQEFLLRRHNGFPVELYDNIKAAEKFSFRVESGIYTTGLAGEIDPYKFTHALIKNAIDNGLRAYENTPIETVTPEGDGLVLETRTRHKIHCKKLVNSCGYAAAKEACKVASLRTSFCVVTEPVKNFNGWYNRCIIRDDGDPYTFMRTTEDNRILIGGLDSTLIDGHGTFAGIIKLPAIVQRKYDVLEQKLISMFTGIDNIKAEYRFSGISADTPDGLPYIGEICGNPNVYYDICCGSNGIIYGMLGANIIRDLYLGHEPQDLDLFCISREC
jgi:glycine/D-amino acid oxidase-like deaminating enzyme